MNKRLFFGFEVDAPWPTSYPNGRLLQENERHMTAFFIGNIDYTKFQQTLLNIPLPNFPTGFAGVFDQLLFLPKRKPHVVAWHVNWLDDAQAFLDYQKTLTKWLQEHLEMPHDDRPFLPHVTICRSPFQKDEWEKQFIPSPMVTKVLHLYESTGNLRYTPIWSYPLTPPFIEIDHTADLAFHVYGKDIKQILIHAQTALAFKFPQMLPFIRQEKDPSDLDEVIVELNDLICEMDQQIGSPFKAISYHGDLDFEKENLYKWELIVDV